VIALLCWRRWCEKTEEGVDVDDICIAYTPLLYPFHRIRRSSHLYTISKKRRRGNIYEPMSIALPSRVTPAMQREHATYGDPTRLT
jgi:hypothetical protein